MLWIDAQWHVASLADEQGTRLLREGQQVSQPMRRDRPPLVSGADTEAAVAIGGLVAGP